MKIGSLHKRLQINISGGFQKKSYLLPVIILIAHHSVMAEQLDDFSSDGCSRFPDGTFSQPNLWCDCCVTHDIAYWQGGNQKQKNEADLALRNCIVQKTESKLLAHTMYYGVLLGGSPSLPTDFRWGYGWEYGRGYQPLTTQEKKQIKDKLHAYSLLPPQSHSFCDYQ